MHRLSDCLQIRQFAVNSVFFFFSDMISDCWLVGPVGQMSRYHCVLFICFPQKEDSIMTHIWPLKLNSHGLRDISS